MAAELTFPELPMIQFKPIGNYFISTLFLTALSWMVIFVIWEDLSIQIQLNANKAILFP